MQKKGPCTISEAKEALENIVRAYLVKNEEGSYIIPEKDRIPAMLIGPPGIGKTDIAGQVAIQQNMGFVSYSLAHHTRSSLLGLPVIITDEYGAKHTEYTMSELIASVEEKRKEGFEKGILFLDEFNCMSETIAPTMLSLLQQKRIGNYSLPEGWIIVLAGNPSEYNKSAKKLDTATADRIRVIEIDADADSFLDYAAKMQLNKDVREFLEMHKSAIYFFDEDHPENIVTPRGWTNLAQTIRANELLGIETDYRTIRQFIRNDKISSAFYEYICRTDKVLGKAEIVSIFKNGEGAAFDACLSRILDIKETGELDYVISDICEHATTIAIELIIKYGMKSDKAAKGLNNIFELLKTIELRKGRGLMKYQKELARRISDSDILVKYASFVDVSGYETVLAADFNLYAG